MKKLDPVVCRETGYIALGVLACSCVMQLVFVLVGAWDITVLLGNLLGGVWGILNFFFMGITMQNSVGLQDAELAKRKIQLSYTVRVLVTCGVVALALALPCFNGIAAVCAVLFPRLTIAVMTPLRKKYDDGEVASAAPDVQNASLNAGAAEADRDGEKEE